MGYRDREKEVKLVVIGASSMRQLRPHLDRSLLRHTRRLIRGRAEDVYWQAPAGARADFIRLRRKGEGRKAVFTIKYTDRGTIRNRVEKDNEVADFDKMLSTLLDVHGSPRGVIMKAYDVYTLGSRGTEADTTVSLYQVHADHRVFIEVEGRSSSIVRHWVTYLASRLPFELVRENRSLYQIFVLKQNASHKNNSYVKNTRFDRIINKRNVSGGKNAKSSKV